MTIFTAIIGIVVCLLCMLLLGVGFWLKWQTEKTNLAIYEAVLQSMFDACKNK